MMSESMIVSTPGVVSNLADRLMRLSPEQLELVARYIDSIEGDGSEELSESMLCALLSEDSLASEWNTPEEDAAWAHL